MKRNTSQCVKCNNCSTEENGKNIMIVCHLRGKKYHYGQYIECDVSNNTKEGLDEKSSKV